MPGARLTRFVVYHLAQGSLLSVNLAHVLVDGTSAFHFLAAWAAQCREGQAAAAIDGDRLDLLGGGLGAVGLRGAAARVLADVLVQALHVFEDLVLAHQLHQGSHHGVGGAAARRIGHLDLALVFGLQQVGPALRHGQLLLRQQLGVVAEAQRPGVDAHRLVAGLRRLRLSPREQLRQRRRLVFDAQAHLGGLQVRVAGAAEPDIGLRVGLLGDQLRQRLARALQRHVDLDAGGLGEHRLDHVAPLGLHRADDVQLAGVLGMCGTGAQRGGGQRNEVGGLHRLLSGVGSASSRRCGLIVAKGRARRPAIAAGQTRGPRTPRPAAVAAAPQPI